MSTEDKVLESGDNIEAVRKQIEYYFSKENLQSDVYLTSQMDAQMSVPISIVMKFAKLKALTQDEATVRKAVEASTTLSIVDNRIKANIKANGRSTIILREIPSDAPEEEVKEIFNYEGCKPISSIRSDIGDTWFVVMETEEDAKDTALDLRLKKRTFRGQPVKARIKTEPVVRSFFPVNTVPVPPVYPMNPMIPFAPMVPDMGMMPYGFVAPPVVETTTTSTSSVENTENTEATAVGDDSEGKAYDETVGDNQNKQSAGRPKDTRRVPRTTTTARDSDTRKRGERRTGERPVKERTDKKPDAPVAKPPIEVNAMTFPPLLGSEETPVPTPGYKEDYVKYNLDEIIAIVKNVKEAQLPSEVKAEEHSLALTTTPNLDLLKRQRTFSIDETREQLRQGRPVQREAIISGAVDYRSLMYGDDSHAASHPAKDASAEQAAPAVTVPSSSTASSSETVAEAPKDAPAAESERAAAAVSSEVPPSSPTKISASTWAAMVKSSAAATQAEAAPAVTNTNNNVPRSASKAKPTNNNNNNASNNNSGKSAEKPAEQTPVKGKSKNNDNKGEKSHEKKSAQKSNKDDKKKEKKASDTETQESATTDDVKAVEAATEKLSINNDTTNDTSNASGWGGKASFANVLKQKLTEEGATGEEHKAATENTNAGKAAATNDKNKNKNKSNTDQRYKNNNNNASGSAPNTFRNARNNNNKTDGKKPSPANADGMWVKETLPALPTDK